MAWNWPRGGEQASGIPAASAATEARPVSRSPFTVTHAEHVVGADGVARPTGRTFDATYHCADPATCGSEFQSSDADSLTVTCTRCGRTGTVDLGACELIDVEVSA